ncbi:FRG domain-containing protein [Oecophyllibacter saccharovorans]|uniref:FRG domain-containing protein n=1 Tax=Oecophyllibacter saccharovorans TaxID=2558360 RepID=A0A506UKS3_9PROT|nr:FRG domain-containing protein [Oecophyllibacter saccharovorans]TPW33832.1 FRG domain-containing protein [Oecophyllibacter saccharovorans]
MTNRDNEDLKVINSVEDAIFFATEKRKCNSRDVFLTFRGQNEFRWGLEPSLFRSYNGKEIFLDHEYQIYNEALCRAPEEFSKNKYTIQNLIKMQHYGIPTRLLDVTLNPLVALYFACVGHEKKSCEKDGALFFINSPKSSVNYEDSYDVSFLSNIAKIDIYTTHSWSSEEGMKIKYYSENAETSKKKLLFRRLDEYKCLEEFRFILLEGLEKDKGSYKNVGVGEIRYEDMIKYINSELNPAYYLNNLCQSEGFQPLSENFFERESYYLFNTLSTKVILVKPKLSDKRLVAQAALFYLYGLKGENSHFPDFEKFKVNGENKEKILNDLRDNYNISTSTLYPDIEHYAQELKEFYMSRM